jgi:hypothetical protein
MSEQKYQHVFRPTGQDEGWLVAMTMAEAQEIQDRIDELNDGEDPFYIYPLDSTHSLQEIKDVLDEYTKELLEELE